LECAGKEYDLGGLVVLADEGCNGTVAGTRDDVEEFLGHLYALYGTDGWCNKFSFCEERPFPRFRVKVRKEIVTTGDNIECLQGRDSLEPQEWHLELQKGESLLLDVRNDYEVEIGKFDGAVNPKIPTFQELPEYLKKAGISKDKKMMIYCTGGIRCEKALVELEREGFNNIRHLKGGILRYLEEYPDGAWEGECFVFDHRVALDKFLQPSKSWILCTDCGQPFKPSKNNKCSCLKCGAKVQTNSEVQLSVETSLS